MTKRKSIVSKILLAIVALTLISCCFLGSTFARYTSGGTGSAGTSVAKWDVGFDTEGQTEITETKLSPSMDEYKGADDKRTNSTGKILVATITNSGEVKASVTITAGAETVELQAPQPSKTTGFYAKTDKKYAVLASFFCCRLGLNERGGGKVGICSCFYNNLLL